MKPKRRIHMNYIPSRSQKTIIRDALNRTRPVDKDPSPHHNQTTEDHLRELKVREEWNLIIRDYLLLYKDFKTNKTEKDCLLLLQYAPIIAKGFTEFAKSKGISYYQNRQKPEHNIRSSSRRF
jgi:hypothetical protein